MGEWESAKYTHVSLITVDPGFRALNEDFFLYVTFWSTSRKWSVKEQSTGEASASYLTPCGAMKVKARGLNSVGEDKLGQMSRVVCVCLRSDGGKMSYNHYSFCKKLVLKNCNYSVVWKWIIMPNYLIVISDNEKTDFIAMNTHCIHKSMKVSLAKWT